MRLQELMFIIIDRWHSGHLGRLYVNDTIRVLSLLEIKINLYFILL